MTVALPIPIEFSLPDGWRSVPPEDAGVADVAFVALHPETSAGFTANITISGEVRSDGASLTQLADESLGVLERDVGPVQLGQRSEVGSEESPGLTQALSMTADVDGERQNLVQLQVFLSAADTGGSGQRAVLQLVLTATPAQFTVLVGDFQRFVSTVRPDTGEAS